MRVPVCPECREIRIAIKPGMAERRALNTMTLTSVATASATAAATAVASVDFLANFHRKETK